MGINVARVTDLLSRTKTALTANWALITPVSPGDRDGIILSNTGVTDMMIWAVGSAEDVPAGAAAAGDGETLAAGEMIGLDYGGSIKVYGASLAGSGTVIVRETK